MKPKPGALVIALGKKKPSSDDPKAQEKMRTAGEDLLSAFNSGDPMEVYKAFEHAKDVCEVYGDAPGDEDDDDDDEGDEGGY